MDPGLKKAIAAASLVAFGREGAELVYHGKIGHALPSALQMATMSSTTASSTTVFVTHFGNAATEAVYPNVADSKMLKNDGQMQSTSKT